MRVPLELIVFSCCCWHRGRGCLRHNSSVLEKESAEKKTQINIVVLCQCPFAHESMKQATNSRKHNKKNGKQFGCSSGWREGCENLLGNL